MSCLPGTVTQLFGGGFQPSECLRALVFFRDGDLGSLGDSDQRLLVDAVTAVRDLPEARIVSRRLGLDLKRQRGGPA